MRHSARPARPSQRLALACCVLLAHPPAQGRGADADKNVLNLRAQLGKVLFFDPRLSGDNRTACADCHRPERGWTDGLPVAIGPRGKRLARRTPTLWNVSSASAYFWDGRAASLEEQALGPLQDPDEMNQRLDALVKKLSKIAGYRSLFNRAFPMAGITGETVVQALASFERTLVVGKSAFARWRRGEEDALSSEAKRGFDLFTRHCLRCHYGPSLSDGRFWDIGVEGADSGRGSLHEGAYEHQHTFRTPTLWGVAQRGPYMHNGSEQTLTDVLELYTLGGRVRTRPALAIKAIPLSQGDKTDLLQLLESFNLEDVVIERPAVPR
jgi:cytochrome c peroxidase